MSMIKRPVGVVVLALLASAPALRAVDPEPEPRAVAGLQMAVDPSTGRLTAPTPEQRARLAAALARMIDQRTEGLEVRRLPNGMHLVDLQGRFQSVEVAVRGTDGVVHLRCIDSPDDLKSLLEREHTPSPAPPPATEER
jgi:hypothetical protein